MFIDVASLIRKMITGRNATAIQGDRLEMINHIQDKIDELKELSRRLFRRVANGPLIDLSEKLDEVLQQYEEIFNTRPPGWEHWQKPQT